MKKYICCLILLLCSFYIHAQSSQKLDSLKKVLAKLPPEGRSFAADTTRVRILCEIGRQSPLNQLNSTIEGLETPLIISQNINWLLGECMTYYEIGYLNVGKNDVVKGVDFLYKSLNIAEKNNFAYYIAMNHKTLGDAYSMLEDNNKAKEHLIKSLQILKKLNNKREELLALNNLGLVYFRDKDYVKSLSYFKQCLAENQVYNINNLDDIFLANLGSSLRFLGNYSASLAALKLVEKNLEKKAAYQYRRILNLISIAELHLLQNNSKSAKYYLDRVQILQKSYGTDISQKDIYLAYYKFYKKIMKMK